MRWPILLVILLAHSSANADDWRIPHNRMKTLYSQGDYRAALPYAEEALRLSSQEFGERHATTVVLLANVGLVHNKLGDNQKAASFLRRSVVAEMGVSGAEHPKVAKGLMDLGLVYEELGDDGLAEIAFTRALAIYRSTLGDNASETKRSAKFVERVSQKQLLAHADQTKPTLSTPAIARSRARQPSSQSTPEALQKPQPLSYEDGQVQNDALSQHDTSSEYTSTQRAVALAMVVIGLGSLCLQFCAPSAFGSAATHVVAAFRSIRRQFAAAMEARARANAERQQRLKHEREVEQKRKQEEIEHARAKQLHERMQLQGRKKTEASARPKQSSKSPEQNYALPDWVLFVLFWLVFFVGCPAALTFLIPQNSNSSSNRPYDDTDYLGPPDAPWRGGPY